MTALSTTKPIIVAILGFCALLLGTAVVTLQLQVNQERQRLLGHPKTPKPVVNTSRLTTIRPSLPNTRQDVHLQESYPPPHGSSWKTTGEAHWKHAAAYLQEWDALLENSDDLLVQSSHPRLSLELAADAGHPLAQYHLANAHASGIWPFPMVDPVTENQLHVFDEWLPTHHGDHPQFTKAFLLYHMSAMAGNVEAALALAYRLHLSAAAGTPSSPTCTDVLPYYEAAANGIMDQLESSPNSRAKVHPFMDRHNLATVHMHGGTNSQLDDSNKAYDSEEALQYLHMRAKAPRSPKETDDKTYVRADRDAGSPALTLASVYHAGPSQNLTRALEYYEIAARQGFWEAAGQAGRFYFWGIGVEQNVEKALTYFTMGAPLSLQGCRKAHETVLAMKDSEDQGLEGAADCEEESLNGLGLVHLFGIPDKYNVDLAVAEQYFTLAQEQGSADAMYNLGMMWLGWKTHYKHPEDLKDDGYSVDDPPAAAVFPGADTKEGGKEKESQNYALHVSQRSDKTFKGPTQSDIKNAVALLQRAAKKGHLQATHRLGLLYSEGVQIQTSALKYEAWKKDCEEATTHFQWIVERVSPARSTRLQQAYKAYVAGDYDVSLRNYLAAAETGSISGQTNAAFLLEQGVCLELSPADCAKAAVRLWKAAAARGSPEAYLRVGDFYYYGRLRDNILPAGPFGWVQYILYPEYYLPKLFQQWGKKETKDDDVIEADLSMAAHYYMEAVEKYETPRGNFNLGFMHEWGLGVKQDFPLAKRHYDLAVSTSKGQQAELAVQVALFAMSCHESVVKLQVGWNNWWNKETSSTTTSPTPVPIPGEKTQVGEPVPGTDQRRLHKTREEVILSHIFDWSSFVIVALLYIVVQLWQIRARRRQPPNTQ